MLQQLLEKSRSYRTFDETRKVSRQELMELIKATRVAPTGNNRQELRFFLIYDEDNLKKMQPLTSWAKTIQKELMLPPEGKMPQAFIVICSDNRILENGMIVHMDTGISAQTMMLKAAEMGLGGCMIASFNRVKFKETFEIPNHLEPQLALAFGKPAEEVCLTEVKDSTDYYRKNSVHYVPKQSAEELVIN